MAAACLAASCWLWKMGGVRVFSDANAMCEQRLDAQSRLLQEDANTAQALAQQDRAEEAQRVEDVR